MVPTPSSLTMRTWVPCFSRMPRTIESRIRHQEQRQLLFELDTARRLSFQRHGKDELFDLISRSYSNLLRRWDG